MDAFLLQAETSCQVIKEQPSITLAPLPSSTLYTAQEIIQYVQNTLNETDKFVQCTIDALNTYPSGTIFGQDDIKKCLKWLNIVITVCFLTSTKFNKKVIAQSAGFEPGAGIVYTCASNTRLFLICCKI